MLFSKFPQVKLLEGPTPLQQLKRYGAAVGHDSLYMKRDDVMTLGMGGNKVRNLEFWLGDALSKNADVIIACGGLQSNQCRLTAAATAKLGLECILVHNDDKPDVYQGNMLLNHLLGVQQIYLGKVDEDVRAQKAQQLADDLREQGRTPYLIGDPALGALGYATMALELHQQAKQQELDLKHVVIVGAMGHTATGFAFGTALLGAPFKVHVISVEYKLGYLHQRMDTIFDSVIELTGVKPSVALKNTVTLYEGYLGDGYAIPTKQSLQTIFNMAQYEGLFLENVYSSKTVWGGTHLIEQGVIPTDEAVCFIHTGGGPALFSQGHLFE